MTAYTEGQKPCEALSFEIHPSYCRESITVVSGAGVVKAGTILGKITASGKFEPYDDGNTGGSEAAVCMNLYEVDATSADVTVTAVMRGVVIAKDALQWKTGNDTTSKNAAYAALKTLTIIAL